MRNVRAHGTSAEKAVRGILRQLKVRGYRLNRGSLPGKPDISFGRTRKAIFVHGCFWHGHDCAAGTKPISTNVEYWREKICRNQWRDANHLAHLLEHGWECLVIWECELKDPPQVARRVKDFTKA
jgi:DNA mismatch endonuclease, patch repair protein